MDTVNAVPVFLYILVLAGMAVGLLVVSRLLNPRQFVGPVQKMPYESGMDPIHDTRRRFDVRFHLIAIAFLVFDVEVLFLYPWAVAAKRPDPPRLQLIVDDTGSMPVVDNTGSMHASPGIAGIKAHVAANAVQPKSYDISTAVADGLASDRNIVFAGAAVFFLLLALGFIYDWRKGVFQWR